LDTEVIADGVLTVKLPQAVAKGTVISIEPE
jgi:hypothetical protein